MIHYVRYFLVRCAVINLRFPWRWYVGEVSGADTCDAIKMIYRFFVWRRVVCFARLACLARCVRPAADWIEPVGG